MISLNCFVFAPALDGPSADTEESGDLFVRALHSAELFEFDQVDFRFRPWHSSPLLFEQPQFGAPVRERENQPLDVGIARHQFRFDGRNLPAATFDSCCEPPSFRL